MAIVAGYNADQFDFINISLIYLHLHLYDYLIWFKMFKRQEFSGFWMASQQQAGVVQHMQR